MSEKPLPHPQQIYAYPGFANTGMVGRPKHTPIGEALPTIRDTVLNFYKLIMEPYCSMYNKKDLVQLYKSKCRIKEVVRPRQVVMFFQYTYTTAALTYIGGMCGDRDHTCVIHSVDKVIDDMVVDIDFRDEMITLHNLITQKVKPNPNNGRCSFETVLKDVTNHLNYRKRKNINSI